MDNPRQTTLFRRELERRVNTSFRPVAEIYHEVANELRFQHVAARVPFPSIRTTMYNWSRRRPLPNITTYRSVIANLRLPSWLSLLRLTNVRLRIRLASTNNNAKSLIFMPDVQYLRDLNRRATVNVAFCNWSLPDVGNTTDLLVITVNHQGCTLPVGWAAMNVKNENIIERVLEIIEEEFESINNIYTSPELLTVTRRVFPDASVQLSFAETAVSLINMMYTNNIDVNDENIQNVLSQILGIFLLPRCLARTSFDYVIENMDDATRIVMGNSIAFIQENYINQLFSMDPNNPPYDVMDDTWLNNIRHMQGEMRNGHYVNTFEFIQALLYFLEDSRSKIIKLKNRIGVPSVKVRLCLNKVKLRNFWKWNTIDKPIDQIFLKLQSIITPFIRDTCMEKVTI
ncbi:hypothetical protein HCN44_011046 [Aphidius gifuensis]|uniref:Uncharacterized protein n=1 Tax=Aphidius gifuensis TaxID=684658 RepID=A0A834XY64_APHGI|nr:hypothetical protein HCN44_011046 [Aphidius gifuensis]